jgi:hypothetical protein
MILLSPKFEQLSFGPSKHLLQNKNDFLPKKILSSFLELKDSKRSAKTENGHFHASDRIHKC